MAGYEDNAVTLPDFSLLATNFNAVGAEPGAAPTPLAESEELELDATPATVDMALNPNSSVVRPTDEFTVSVEVLADGWTVVTTDRAPSAHFEHTVAILPDHTEILTGS